MRSRVSALEHGYGLGEDNRGGNVMNEFANKCGENGIEPDEIENILEQRIEYQLQCSNYFDDEEELNDDQSQNWDNDYCRHVPTVRRERRSKKNKQPKGKSAL